MPQTLLIATHNQGKLREYRVLLHDLDISVVNLDEAGVDFDVEETGTTFAANAILKARAYADATGLLTWADDSGLEVDALDGRPGVFSARYGGPGLSDTDRYLKLLDELSQYPARPRTARFRCIVALAAPGRTLHTSEGMIEGQILTAPRGDHGFGYDPVFYVPEHQAAMAELSSAIKNQISHRGRASAAAKRWLTANLASIDIE